MAGCISVLICAYNEANRIETVLRALARHPLVTEVVVVDDGSTDATAEKVRGFPQVRLISYQPNRGKTYALACGAAAVNCEHVMLLDADLDGVDAEAITALAAPILAGEAEVSISLRANSLSLYKWLGLDFVSGERVLPRRLLVDKAEEMKTLPRWAAEAFINDEIIRRQLRLTVVSWPGVRHTPKRFKVGGGRAIAENLSMINDALEVLRPIGIVRQNLALLKLTRRDAEDPAELQT